MLINELKVNKKKSKKRVGRGGVHGTYSTRGGKGQTARSGASFYLGFEGGRSGLKKQIHKLGGFKSIHPKSQVISLDDLNKNFQEGDIVNSASLADKMIIKNAKIKFKILDKGEITKKLIIKQCPISESAKKKIEEKGGEVS